MICIVIPAYKHSFQIFIAHLLCTRHIGSLSNAWLTSNLALFTYYKNDSFSYLPFQVDLCFLKAKSLSAQSLPVTTSQRRKYLNKISKLPNGNYTINNNYNTKKEEGKEKGKSEGIPHCQCFFSCLILIIILWGR